VPHILYFDVNQKIKVIRVVIKKDKNNNDEIYCHILPVNNVMPMVFSLKQVQEYTKEDELPNDTNPPMEQQGGKRKTKKRKSMRKK